MKPPLLPEETLRRMLRLAWFDGLSVAVISGIFALVSVAMADRVGAVVGLLVACAGVIELRGVSLLKAREPRGINWLVGSQFFLLVTVIGYCGVRLANVDLTLLRAVVNDDMKATLEAAGYTADEFLGLAYRLAYRAVAATTLLYQGGMIVYYLRRRKAVIVALAGG